WDRGVMRNLETMLAPGSIGWRLHAANGINNRGEIVGVAGSGPDGSPGGAVLLRPLPVIAECAGDANFDGAVGLADIALIVTNWGRVAPAGRFGDLSLDNIVGLSDLAVVIANWDASCP